MAEPAPRILWSLLLGMVIGLAPLNAPAQTLQQYVYGSVPATSTTSEVAAYSKNGSTGALSALLASPFADALQGGAVAIDGQGRFLFVVNPSTSNISMFQIDQTTGNLSEVKGSPFSTGPTENPQMAATSPNCLATEKSGQFLYVGYRFGNFSGQGSVNEYLIDATNLQLVPLAGQPTLDIPSSPIGLIADPKGAHLYVGLGANETTGIQDAETQVYSIDSATGQLSLVGSAGNARTNGTAIAIDPQGRFFFDGWGSSTGAAIDSALISPADGTATTGISTVPLPSGIVPSAMLAESSGKFMYVQEGNTAFAYSINQTTGALTQGPARLAVLSFGFGTAAADPLGPYIYSLQSDGIHGLLVDPTSGNLSDIPGSPFSIGAVSRGKLTITGAPAVQAVSGPVAQFFPPSVNFGSVALGQTSNSQMVTLTNTGGQQLDLSSIALGGSDAGDFVATPNCPAVLAVNVTCSISVDFVPAAAGLREAALLARDNAPGSPQSIPLSGTGIAAQPAVTLSPGALSFPTTTQGNTSASQSVTVTNSGNATLHVSSVLLSGANPNDFVMVNGCSGAYPVNATCTVNVSFSPQGAGQRLASVLITDDAPGSPQPVQLSGMGGALPSTKPGVTLSTSAISFGAVTQGTTGAPRNITLTNSGGSTLHISSVQLGGVSPGDVSLSNGCNAGSYVVNASCTLTVTFAPVDLGQRSASITIADDAPNSPQTISISASVNPALTVAPAVSGGTTVTVPSGQIANFNLVLTPGAGFSGSASFTCSGAPTAAMCSAPSLQLTGATPVPYTISVSTTGSARIISRLRWPDPKRPKVVRWLGVLSFSGVLSLVAFCFGALRRQTNGISLLRAREAMAFALFVMAVNVAGVYAAGCGGGSVGRVSAQATPTLVTPSGTTTLTVTPVVTTSSGKQLPPLQAIQLTLIVN